jgi:5,10-methylenetetrahydrofolate reductase
MPTSKTADRIAKEHGVDEKTVRRAGQFQEAACKLGIEKDIAAGKLKATEAVVVKAARSLPDAPSESEIEEAVKAARDAPAKQRRGIVKNKDAFRPLPPTKCIAAIEFYGAEFLERCPNRAGELRSVLVRLIESCDSTS